jgi:hypothetical protein
MGVAAGGRTASARSSGVAVKRSQRGARAEFMPWETPPVAQESLRKTRYEGRLKRFFDHVTHL